jgi:hypothetical protein
MRFCCCGGVKAWSLFVGGLDQGWIVDATLAGRRGKKKGKRVPGFDEARADEAAPRPAPPTHGRQKPRARAQSSRPRARHPLHCSQ